MAAILCQWPQFQQVSGAETTETAEKSAGTDHEFPEMQAVVVCVVVVVAVVAASGISCLIDIALWLDVDYLDK